MPTATTALTKKEKLAVEARKFIARVYGWMAVALIVSGVSAFLAAASPAAYSLIWGGKHIGFYVLVAVEILLVIVISASIAKIPVGAAGFLFVLYSIVNGLTLSTIFFAYELGSIYVTFFIAASMFAALRSFILSSAISLTCAFVIFATFVLFGAPLPFSMPHAFLMSTAAGGVFVTKLNVLSS